MPRAVATLFFFVSFFAASASALSVSTTWTSPRLYGYPPPSDLSLEGSVQVHYLGDEAMSPLASDWLYRTADDHWWGRMAWNLEVAEPVTFVSDDGDTVLVTAQRQPARPLAPSTHTGLILDVTTERQHLWGPDTGIYVWGLHENCLQTGEEWERPAMVTAYDPTGAPMWIESVGLRINGQSTRRHQRKGLRTYFDRDLDTPDWLLADVFGDGLQRHARLVFKSTLLPGFLVSSSMIEPLHQELGHLGSRHRLTAMYLEGDYWGAYSVRERLDDEFIEVTHNLADDGDYTFIKDMESVEGDPAAWTEFLDTYAAPPQAYGSHDWYEAVAERLDLPSYMDWLILNIMGAAGDNGWVNNMALFRLDSGPWRYVMWDEEGLFAEANLAANHFRFYAAADAAEYEEFRPPVWSMGDWWPPQQPWRDLFRGLMQNSQFKARFSARLDELLDGPLSETSLHARLDSLDAEHGPEMALHGERWGLAAGAYEDEVARVRQWLSLRLPVVAQLGDEFMEHFAVPVELTEFDAHGQLDGVQLDWRTERERDNLGFSVWRTLEQDGELERIADWRDLPELAGAIHSDEARDYAYFDPTVLPGATAWYQLRHENTVGGVVVHDWLERVGPPSMPPLRLNEFMADNDTTVADEAGEFDDWLELVNIGDEPVGLAGLALADDHLATTPWRLPDVILEAGDHLLVWCDNDEVQGPLHADFKLSAGGESLVLFLLDGDVDWVVDALDFGPQVADISVGRLPDGVGPWTVQEVPTPGTANDTLAPVPPGSSAGAWLRSAHPNPCNPRTVIAFGLAQAGQVRVEIYDVAGRLVRSLVDGVRPVGDHRVVWDGRDDSGRGVPSGTYVVRMVAQGVVQGHKVMLVR